MSALYQILDWRLLTIILLMMVLPSVYNSYSVYLIGQWPPSDEGLPIAAQWQFVQLLIEVIQESLVIPLFYYVGIYRFKEKSDQFVRIHSALTLAVLVLIVLLLMLLLFMPKFVDSIQTSNQLRTQTIQYLRIRLASALCGIMNLGFIVIFEAFGKRKILLGLLLIRSLLHLFFDALFFGTYSFSFGMGINGVAWSNVLTECLVFLFSVYWLNKALGMTGRDWLQPIQKPALKVFIRVSKWIAMESSLRNLVYFFMILVLINELGGKQIGAYYLSMHLYWSFCLLPINAIAEVLKAQIGNSANDLAKVKHLLKIGFIMGGGAILVGWGLVYMNLNLILDFFNNDSLLVQYAYHSFVILLLPYALLAINLIGDSAFIGLGKTRYLAYQSITTNLLVYGSAYILYLTDCWIPDFDSILLLFSIGILVDSALTWYYLYVALKLVHD